MPAWLPPSLSPSLPAYLPTYLSIFELKVGFLFYTCSNIFWLALNLYAFKANIKLLCHGIAESFFVYYIVHIIILYIIKAFRFFGASRQPPSTALLDPIWFSTSLSSTWLKSLRTLSYNYWPNEKPSLAALLIQKHYSYTQTGFEASDRADPKTLHKPQTSYLIFGIKLLFYADI